MAVPPQLQLLRPVLEVVNDLHGESVTFPELYGILIRRFSLNSDDLSERMSSGQSKFENRTRWTAFNLKKVGLLETPSRGRYRITELGKNTLASTSDDFDFSLLNRIANAGGGPLPPVHQDFAIEADAGNPPDEQIEVLFGELNRKLADELMDVVGNMHPDRFERLVVRLLEKMGYGRGERVGKSGDGGIDGIIDLDQLGIEKVYVQAKRWQSTVGSPEIHSFSGSLNARGENKGVFITTSNFGPNAREAARNISAGNQFIRLIDGGELAQLMIKHDVGVITETTYHFKKLDENYLSEEL